MKFFHWTVAKHELLKYLVGFIHIQSQMKETCMQLHPLKSSDKAYVPPLLEKNLLDRKFKLFALVTLFLQQNMRIVNIIFEYSAFIIVLLEKTSCVLLSDDVKKIFNICRILNRGIVNLVTNFIIRFCSSNPKNL